MLRSLMAKLKVVTLLAPVAFTATVKSVGVDTAGFGSMFFNLMIGAFAFDGTDKVTITMQHSNTDVDGDYVDVKAGEAYNPEGGAALPAVMKVLDEAGDADKTYNFHYLGSKQFARIVLTEAGTVSTIIAIQAVKGHPQQLPPA